MRRDFNIFRRAVRDILQRLHSIGQAPRQAGERITAVTLIEFFVEQILQDLWGERCQTVVANRRLQVQANFLLIVGDRAFLAVVIAISVYR